MSDVRSILQPVLGHPAFRAACQAAGKPSEVVVSGLTRSAKALVVAGLAHEFQRRLLVLTSDNESADRLQQTTSTFLSWLEGEAGAAVSELPAFDCSPYEGRSPHAEILERRAVALWNVARGSVRILFVPLPAALGRFRESSYYGSLALELKVGEELSLDDLVEHLSRVGYEVGEPVNNVGLFSVRGGILDVYSPEAEWPFRIEFFGDQIESIREFDPSNQRSRKSVPSALLLPLAETTRQGSGVRGQESRFGPSPAPDPWSPAPDMEPPHPNNLVSLFTHALGKRHPLPQESGFRVQSSRFGLPPTPDPRPLTPILVWDEPLELKQQWKRTLEGWAAAFEEVRDMAPPRPRPEEIFLTEAEFLKSVEGVTQIGLKELSVARGPLPVVSSQLSIVSRSESRVQSARSVVSGQLSVAGGQSSAEPATDKGLRTTNELVSEDVGATHVSPVREFVLLTQPAPKFHGAVKAWIEDLGTRLERRETVSIVVPTTRKVERLREILQEYEVPFANLSDSLEPRPTPDSRLPTPDFRLPTPDPRPLTPVLIARGDIEEGLAFPELGLILLSDSDLFGGFVWGTPGRREKSAASTFISDLSDLKVGDYVVHVDHGIGLYHGLRQLEVDGSRRDFMLLTYQDDAKLYVPLERLDLVAKYRSSGATGESSKPVLDRLGGTTWARTKTRVKRALRDMAEELLRLYAERKMSGGVAYGADTPWQKEFEDAFEFEETPDQLNSLADIKRDLESAEPMDRLLCGDVGYGKTELAMRASFKVVQDGNQVAVLAPTTVLAFQHFNTFRQRLTPFPVRVEMLSRFRSTGEQKRIVADTQAGKVDILIGTHRLLSKDVGFRDLGLLIVDEEQRFGVAAKERLKRLRSNVDVLTMSATPIPRTLHMSLGGLRDLSVIETPPLGRLAIQTLVAPFSQSLIQAAILQEMERQGQVYFVHNLVESIFSIAALIQRLVPTARLGIAHGQMGERDLERAMLKFVQGGYDVLVSTAIIENGLDIPRANTMIVNRADRFGLADLYQLRGRVGRSNRRAYAYFLIPAEEALTPIAKRRLAALKEFSDLGAGFRLAALDLELRGAGNLLGREQSGHLNSIGLDLYLKMLEQTVEELKGTPPKPEVRTTLNLGLDIKIPERYIADESQRLRMYKRISCLSTPEARADLEAELVDRYGPIPSSVLNLFNYALLKSAAEQLLVQSLERKADEIWIRFHARAPVDPEKLTRLMRRHREASFRPNGILRLRLPVQDGDLVERIRNVLQELQA